jgi:hypothetical protein
MPRAITFVLLLTAVVAASVAGSGCGSSPGQAASASAPSSAPVATPATSPAAAQSAGSQTAIRARVSADIDRIMADIKASENRGDVVDGVPVGQSSNPYDYVGISPAFTKLVALGRPALPAIAAEIRASDQNGLREYLLAAAGAQIDGDTPGSGAQTWSTGKEWARQYQEDD